MYVLTVGNQKGGVGKSTSSLNICYSLANTYNKKVLLIDADPQGSSSLNLGVDIADEDVNTLDELLQPVVRMKEQFTWEKIENYIYSPTYKEHKRNPVKRNEWTIVDSAFGFDVMPSSLALSVVEMEMGLIGGMTKKGINPFYFRDMVKIIEENTNYDFVIFDTPPSLNSLSMNAMTAAKDGLIIVSNLDVMSIRGISTFIETTDTIKEIDKGHRGILGILLSLYSERRTVDRSIDNWVQEFLPIPTFDTRIPESADVKKANSSMMLYAQINKKARQAFDNLCQEIITAVEHPDQLVGSAKHAVETESE